MTLVEFKRLADAPPPERELLVVEDDGRAVAWRSNGRAVGRFAGPVRNAGGLRAAAESAMQADPPAVDGPRADASVEVVTTAGRTARVAARRPVEGPWSALVEACRSELDAITGSPLAAIAGVVLPGGRLRLEHRGTEPLPVELGALAATFKLWREGRLAASASIPAGGAPGNLGSLEAGPGWTLELGPDGLDLAGGGILAVEATFVADDGGVYVPMRITASTEA
jgi:hypothetical protein